MSNEIGLPDGFDPSPVNKFSLRNAELSRQASEADELRKELTSLRQKLKETVGEGDVSEISSTENFIHDKYGYCYYNVEPDAQPIIFNLYTKIKYRHQGYARKHLEYVIGEIRKTGYEGKIGIEAKPKDNSIRVEDLARFYNSMGLDILPTSNLIKGDGK